MTATDAFWDKIAESYAKRPVQNVENYEDTLARTRGYLGADAQVLELGCGTGTTALKLAPDLGHITATDFAPGMLAVAERRKAEADAQNVTFAQARAGDRWPEAGFDAVLAFNLLHLLRDIPATLAEAHAALKPGGVFISKTATLAEGPFFMGPMIKVMQFFNRAPFVARLSGAGLEGMIRAAGFEIVQTHRYTKTSFFVVARKV